MGKRSAVVELFLGDMGSIQRELRPSTQREDQLTMETKLEQIAVKAVNQLPKSGVGEIRTPRSVGAGGGRPPPATRWDGKRSVAEWPKLPRPSSTCMGCVKRSRYEAMWVISLFDGERHLLVPTWRQLAAWAERGSRVAAGHREAA